MNVCFSPGITLGLGLLLFSPAAVAQNPAASMLAEINALRANPSGYATTMKATWGDTTGNAAIDVNLKDSLNKAINNPGGKYGASKALPTSETLSTLAQQFADNPKVQVQIPDGVAIATDIFDADHKKSVWWYAAYRSQFFCKGRFAQGDLGSAGANAVP